MGVTRTVSVGRYHGTGYSVNLHTGNVSNRDRLGVQKGKAGDITDIMTVTKKIKANLAHKG